MKTPTLVINCKGDLLKVYNVTWFSRTYSCYNYTKEKFENYKEHELCFYDFDDGVI